MDKSLVMRHNNNEGWCRWKHEGDFGLCLSFWLDNVGVILVVRHDSLCCFWLNKTQCEGDLNCYMWLIVFFVFVSFFVFG